ANERAILFEAIIIAGDRAGTDVGPCADFSVADIAQVVDLCAFANLSLLQFDEIADLGAFSQARSGPDPCKRADARFCADSRAFAMAEGVDRCSVRDLDSRAKYDMRLDRDVAAQFGVIGEPHAFRVDQGRAFVQHLFPSTTLPFELKMRELGAAVDARSLI